jgi:hypothetical protein
VEGFREDVTPRRSPVGFEITTSVRASPGRIREVITDVERWPEGTPSMTEVRRLDGGPLVKGSQTRIEQPCQAATV